MAATSRFQLVVEAQARGDAELARMTAEIDKLSAKLGRAHQRISDSAVTAQARYSGAVKKMGADSQVASNAISGATSGFAKFAGAAAGVAVGVSATALSLRSLVQEASEAAFEIRSLSASTGLSIASTDKLRAVAKLSGFDIRNLQEAALDLSQALKDTSGQGESSRQLLRQLGVSAFDATGKTRGLGDVFEDVLDSLSKVENLTDRVNLSRVLGGEDAAKKSQVLISQYAQLNRLATELGFGTRDGLLKALEESSKELRALDLQWEIIKGKLAEKIAPVVVPLIISVVKAVGGDGQDLNDFLFPGARRSGAAVRQTLGAIVSGDETVGINDSERIRVESRAFLSSRAPKVPVGLNDFSTASALAAQFRAGRSGTEESIKLRLSNIGQESATITQQLGDPGVQATARTGLEVRLRAITNEANNLEAALKRIERAKAGAEITASASIGSPFGSQVLVRRQPSLRGRQGFEDLPEFVSKQADRDAANQFIGDTSSVFQREKDVRSRELNAQFARQFVAFEQQRIELLSGPGGELETINKIYELKQAGLKQELEYGTEIFDLTERRLQIEQERTLSILNLQRQRRDEARNLASDFIGSIQSGDPASFLKQQGGRLINQVGTNALTGTFQRIQGTLGSIGAASGLGGLLKGTLLDPANAQPLDRVATATERTAVAAETTAAALTGRSIGGVGSGTITSGFNAIAALGPASGFTRTANGIGAGLSSVLAPGGFFAGLRSPEGSIALGNGQATTTLGLGLDTSKARFANVAGSIAAAGAGAVTAFRGFKQGGVAGISQGITATLGTAALIPGPQQPFIAAAAATAALVSMLLPDPKKGRDAAINRLLDSSIYSETAPLSFQTDRFGLGFDSNKRGEFRSMGEITININALDAGSVMDSRDMIADAVRMAAYEGHGINRAFQETVLGV